MKIRNIFKAKKCVVSCEIFPPKPDMPLSTIFQTLDELVGMPLDFISVTYGAGGSSTARSLEIASKVQNQYKIETLAHLTCVGSSRGDIEQIAAALKRENIENILALRGDLPAHMDPNCCSADYGYASDLIAHLKQLDGFCIGAAAYPEGHPACIDLAADLRNLAYKVEAGADFLISQLFFDNELFYHFIAKIRAMGINSPVSVGIMPVLNIKQIERMTSLCGASIPSKLGAMLERYKDKPADLAAAGMEYACEQIIDLLANGVDGIHLYTMNRASHTKEIMQNTGIINMK
jgi:methylenetetrahydrofolate reductase (NADPH)